MRVIYGNNNNNKKKKSTYKKEMRDLGVDISAYQNNNKNGTTSLVKAIKETEHSRLSAESRSAKLKLRVYLDDNKKKTRAAQPATFPFFFLVRQILLYPSLFFM